MGTDRFDHVTRLVAIVLSRRGLAGVLGLASLAFPRLVDAKKGKRRRKRKRNKTKNVTLNDFGCVNVGGSCKNDDQCCSGICEGKKDRKMCQAHDQSTCQADDDVCTGLAAPCITSAGVQGGCVRTTGNASYCSGSAICSPCQQDVDCQPLFGPQAACFLCEGDCHSGLTLCGGPQLAG